MAVDHSGGLPGFVAVSELDSITDWIVDIVDADGPDEMAETISNADEADALDGTELVGIVQDDVLVQTTVQDIADLFVVDLEAEIAALAAGVAPAGTETVAVIQSSAAVELTLDQLLTRNDAVANITVQAGLVGNASLLGGAGTGGSGGGYAIVTAGDDDGGGGGGYVLIAAGADTDGSAGGGKVEIKAGASTVAGGGGGGRVDIFGGAAADGGGGAINLNAGDDASGGSGADITISGGLSNDNGGALTISAGAGVSAGTGGKLTLAPGICAGGTGGVLALKNLPTALPADGAIANREVTFWVDEVGNKLMIKLKYAAGTVKVGEIALT